LSDTGVATVPLWLGFEETEDMVLVEAEMGILLDDDRSTEEHLGLLFASR